MYWQSISFKCICALLNLVCNFMEIMHEMYWAMLFVVDISTFYSWRQILWREGFLLVVNRLYVSVLLVYKVIVELINNKEIKEWKMLEVTYLV